MGGVTERLMVAVLKTAPRLCRGVGSNPTPSASLEIAYQRCERLFMPGKSGIYKSSFASRGFMPRPKICGMQKCRLKENSEET